MKCTISISLFLVKILFHTPLITDCASLNQEIWVSNLRFLSNVCWITPWSSGEESSSEVDQGQLLIKWPKQQSTSLEEREWIVSNLLALSSGFQVWCTVMTSDRQTALCLPGMINIRLTFLKAGCMPLVWPRLQLWYERASSLLNESAELLVRFCFTIPTEGLFPVLCYISAKRTPCDGGTIPRCCPCLSSSSNFPVSGRELLRKQEQYPRIPWNFLYWVVGTRLVAELVLYLFYSQILA